MTRLCGHFPFVPCYSERSEESEVCEWRMCNDFRFFTPLRCVQNDRAKMRCVRNDRVNTRCIQGDGIDILLKSKTRCVSNVNRAKFTKLQGYLNSE